jgi:hypothetical protein
MSFGMQTRRWGILRKPLVASLGIKKQTETAMACCRLHNFCIGPDNATEAVERILPLMDRDEFTAQSEGGLSYGVSVGNGERRPDSLLDGSNHFDDVPSSERRSRQPDTVRRRMKARVEQLGYHRPRLAYEITLKSRLNYVDYTYYFNSISNVY